jgi:hypothetical protein
MPLASLDVPLDHPDWIFDPKLDDFHALAYFEIGRVRLVSRKRNVYKSLPALTADLQVALPG